jgi:hypothetical protein
MVGMAQGSPQGGARVTAECNVQTGLTRLLGPRRGNNRKRAATLAALVRYEMLPRPEKRQDFLLIAAISCGAVALIGIFHTATKPEKYLD